MSDDLGPIDIERKTGGEAFHEDGDCFDFDVLDFWQWSTSDLVTNATRGILAEYLLARAVGDAGDIRGEWDAFDAKTQEGVRVEVKSSAYPQGWHQNDYSRPSFGTRPTQAWDAGERSWTGERKRQADVYVFCLLAHKDQATVDPLDVSQWRFFVVSAETLNGELGEQKSLGINRLKEVATIEPQYDQIAEAVGCVLSDEHLKDEEK